MHDRFAKNDIKEFFDIASDFGQSLAEAFPNCMETKDWNLWVTNVIGTDEGRRVDAIRKWCTSVRKPLARGTAKYLKAVQSITGSPATVYHAIVYRDTQAVHGNDETLQRLDVPSKLSSACMDEKNTRIFWRYLEELNKHAFAAVNETPPTVPTPADIERNILQRRDQKSRSSCDAPTPPGPPPASSNGMHDLWSLLAASRGVDAQCMSRENLSASMAKLDVAAVRSRSRAAVLDALPEIGAAELDAEQWSLLEKMADLAQMESAIPPSMMRGIETVAADLVRKLETGEVDMSKINIEQIGQQVLGGVGDADVSAFAENLDTIVPALHRLQR